MSGPIQTNPRGLLGLMQLKNMGQSPRDFLDSVQSGVEIDRYYQRNQAALRPGIASTALVTGSWSLARFTTNPLKVPQDEVWWVEHFTLNVAVAAADEIVRLQPVIFYTDPTTDDWSVLENGGGSQPAIGIGTAIAVSSRDFWCPPGAELGYIHGGVFLAAGSTLFGRVRRSVLTV